MPERHLKLTKPWAGHKSGAELAVLAPGEDPRPGAVDPAKAATLIALHLAADPAAPAAPKPEKSSRKEA